MARSGSARAQVGRRRDKFLEDTDDCDTRLSGRSHCSTKSGPPSMDESSSAHRHPTLKLKFSDFLQIKCERSISVPVFVAQCTSRGAFGSCKKPTCCGVAESRKDPSWAAAPYLIA